MGNACCVCVKRCINRCKTFKPTKTEGLDLSYVPNGSGSQIVAMCIPAKGVKGQLLRNDVDQVADFLNSKHQSTYRMYNLTEKDMPYPLDRFWGEYGWVPFPDHNVPTFEEMFDFCEDASAFARLSPHHTLVVHCKAGKGRTGTMICAFLLYVGFCRSVGEALHLFATSRSRKNKKTQGHRGVENPSQIRWVMYFDLVLQYGGRRALQRWQGMETTRDGEEKQMLEGPDDPGTTTTTTSTTTTTTTTTTSGTPSSVGDSDEKRAPSGTAGGERKATLSKKLSAPKGMYRTLTQVIIHGDLPSESGSCDPAISVKRWAPTTAGSETLYDSKSRPQCFRDSSRNCHVWVFDCSVRLYDETKIVLCTNDHLWWSQARYCAHTWVHPMMVSSKHNRIILHRTQIDGAHKDKRFSPSFSLELVFAPLPEDAVDVFDIEHFQGNPYQLPVDSERNVEGGGRYVKNPSVFAHLERIREAQRNTYQPPSM